MVELQILKTNVSDINCTDLIHYWKDTCTGPSKHIHPIFIKKIKQTEMLLRILIFLMIESRLYFLEAYTVVSLCCLYKTVVV